MAPTRTVAFVALGLAAALTGCSRQADLGASTPVALSASPTPAPSSTAVSSANPVVTREASHRVSTAPASSSAAPPASSTATAPPICQAAQLSLNVVQGASANQHAFATLVLTNRGASACELSGFPGVSLLSNGDQIGPDAARTKTGYRAVELQPGASAHALLSVSTACDAGRSDSVRVYPPNDKAALLGPLSVYACASEVSPVQPGPS